MSSSFDDLKTDLGSGAAPGEPRVLVAVWNGGARTIHLPNEGRLVIGRGADADVRIDHGSVSRSHAALHLHAGGEILLEDLGSSNGSWVDGRPIEPNTPCAVRSAALIELGSVLVVVRDGTARRDPATTQTESPAVTIVDPAMKEVHDLVDVIARSDMSVLFLGETGVGKEVLADRLHALSRRAARPFIKVNCAALVESLLEAELFGYERGAFTGAAQAKPGILEAACGGSLFLDELGEMPLTTQAKLLRVLEGGEVTRIGSLKPRPIDVRFVSATNRDLQDLIRLGQFREDLYFRLDGLSIRIPPLRERPLEIPVLTATFIADACARAERPLLRVSDGALRLLCSYPWPGNVRQLRTVIARTVILCRGDVIAADDIKLEPMGAVAHAADEPAAAAVTSAGSDAVTIRPPALRMGTAIPDQERERIVQALEKSGGNQTRAAADLGIARRTLVKRLDALGLPRPRKREDDLD